MILASILGLSLAGTVALAARTDGESPKHSPHNALIRNHSVWRDTRGNRIDCHEGGILRVGDTYYWYGRSYHGNDRGIYGTEGAKYRCGLTCYSSKNLADWTFEGVILSYPDSGWLTEGTWHRPRVLYNAKTKKYILWFFCLGIPGGKPWVKDVVAVADRPTGPFTIAGVPETGIDPSGDIALFQDIDGKGYIANGDWKRNGFVSRLSEDFQNAAGEPVVALPAIGSVCYEGLCLARYKGKYLVAGSFVRGLDPSDTTYAVADAPMGPYVVKGLMSQQNTWRSQISSLCYIPETDCLFALCEQWLIGPDGKTVPAEQSAQLWLPVIFDPVTGSAHMKYIKQWNPHQVQK